MNLPIAHAGHWYHAVLYMLPVVLIGGALWWSGRREARERATRPPDGPDQD